MPKAAPNQWGKASGKGGGGSKKWAVKSGERGEGGKNGGTASDEVTVTSPKSPTKYADGVYSVLTLLSQGYPIFKKKLEGKLDPKEEETSEAAVGEAFAPKISTKEREKDEDGDEGAEVVKTPSRKARERAGVKKADKLPKSSMASGIDVAGESSPKSPESPSKKIQLSKELPIESASAEPFIPQAHMTAQHSMAMYQQAMAQNMQMMMANSQAATATTVMLRNIPNRYTRDMLIERLNRPTAEGGYKDMFDFVYLPIDFNSKCNVGYAFINFRLPEGARKFISEFHNAKTKSVLPGFSSSKVCEVTYARVQGRDANMENLRDDKFIEKLSERKEWQPVFYDQKGREMPFQKTMNLAKKKGRTNSSMGNPAAMGMASPMAMAYNPYGFMPGYSGYPYPGFMNPAHAAAMAGYGRGFS